MKAVVKKPKTTGRAYSERLSDLQPPSGVTIDGKHYEYGKEQVISRELFNKYPDLFNEIKEQSNE